MPLLPFLGSLFTGFAAFFTTWFTKKVALMAAVVSVSALLFVAFAGIIVALFASISLFTPEWMVGGLGLFLPDNAVTCLSTLMTAKVARAGYEYQKENLRLISYIT